MNTNQDSTSLEQASDCTSPTNYVIMVITIINIVISILKQYINNKKHIDACDLIRKVYTSLVSPTGEERPITISVPENLKSSIVKSKPETLDTETTALNNEAQQAK